MGIGGASFVSEGLADPDLAEGADNLVLGCAAVRPGQRVLVVAEDPVLGWFDAAAPLAAADAARRAGATVSVQTVGCPQDGAPQTLGRAIEAADVAIFFARIGDQDRFVDQGPGTLRVVSYARTAAALSSGFGRREHCSMLALKQIVESRLAGAERIEISCPLGTCLIGPGPGGAAEMPDVAVRRFPMCVPAPIDAAAFHGQVVVAGYLTPTGSRAYRPANLFLDRPVVARIEAGRVTDYCGAPATVDKVRAHYRWVADQFGLDADRVHSWHAGIHADCTFDQPADRDPDLWSNSVFGSPRYLHFHTCGDQPPGEICWMVEDPTILADGTPVWRGGELVA